MLVQLGNAATELVTNAAHLSEGLLAEAVRAVTQPAPAWSAARRTLAEAGGVAGALAALLALPDDPPTPLRGDLGARRRVAWARPLPLSEIRTAARALGCTINDVLLSLVAGSLGRHLACRGTDVTGLALRAAVYPHSSASLAFAAASSVTYSTGYLMSRSSSAATLK